MSGDSRILKDQLELGVPLEDAMLLAGYTFEEIENREDSDEIIVIERAAKAQFISKHLVQLNAISDERPSVSQWLLERVVPERFAQNHKLLDFPKLPEVIKLEGVYPDAATDS